MRPSFEYVIDGFGFVRWNSPKGLLSARVEIDAISSPPHGLPFGPFERDLLRIARAAAAADRLSLRQGSSSSYYSRDLSWQRSIRITVALEEASRWSALIGRVEDVLRFLTDDEWQLACVQLVKREALQASLAPGPLTRDTEVALFRGGLDSAAGAVARARRGVRHQTAVSIYRTAVRQVAQAGGVACLRKLGIPMSWVGVATRLRDRPAKLETSFRSRGFLFLSVGAAIAAALGRQALYVYETGVGAVNLPLTHAQVGAEAARATHPGTLLKMEGLLSAATERPFTINLPFALLTKGELCRDVGSAAADLARSCSSCDEGEGHKADPSEHCGICSSCVFRRIALATAMGAADDPTCYRDQVSATRDDYGLVALERQGIELAGSAPRYSALLDIDPEMRHLVDYLASHGGLHTEVEDQVSQLFHRYAAEVAAFMASARPTPVWSVRRMEEDHALFSAVG